MAKLLYAQTEFPIFQNRMYESYEEARQCPRGDIRLIEDPVTGIVCNSAFQPELLIYDQHYQNEQGNSPSFQEHLNKVADIVEVQLGSNNLLEIGCGKGFFLDILLARGVDVRGVDPAYEGHNERIQRELFLPEVSKRADGLILRHVLEHIQHPMQFLKQLADANEYTGRVYIEVPCFDWICSRNAWFDIFYEHVNYFRLDDFYRMFGKIVESGKLFGGQYLYVVAELSSFRTPAPSQKPVSFPSNFLASVLNFSAQNNQPKIIWGGASKGVIFALMMERSGVQVQAVIDINPAKQGKFIAVTGLKIFSPEQVLPSLPPTSQIYVMNSNYMDEIITATNNIYTYIGVDNE